MKEGPWCVVCRSLMGTHTLQDLVRCNARREQQNRELIEAAKLRAKIQELEANLTDWNRP